MRNRISLIEPVGGHGGMNYYNFGLASGLASNDSIVDYYTCNNTLERSFSNVALIRSFGDIWHVKGIKRGYYFLKGYVRAFLNSRRKQSAVFHFHFFDLGILNLMVLLIASFFKQKKVVTLHDVNPFHGNTNRLIEKVAFSLIDGVIVHNLASKNALIKKKIALPKLAVIPHGNYLPFVSMLPVPKDDGKMRLLFFGQIKEVKGLDVLLKAMAIAVKENPNYKLTIAGRPWKTDFQKYDQMIADLGLADFVETQIRYIEEEEIATFYKEADVVVLPYRHIYQSGVLLLTWSYGRTVIASNLDPFKELIINFENGFLFESENPADLARCILKISHDDIVKTTLNSRKLIENEFDWSTIGRQTLDFYNNL